MVTSFIEYMGWVSLSVNLKKSFEKAQHIAFELNHQVLDIPHLLYALIDNPEAAIALAAHDIDRQQLRHHLNHHELAAQAKDSFFPKSCTSGANDDGERPSLKPAKRIQRLMAQASQKAEMMGKVEIDGEDVINALITIEKEISNHYSQNNHDIKQDLAPNGFYKYQEDLFAYDKNSRLTNWKFSPLQTRHSDLYLTQHHHQECPQQQIKQSHCDTAERQNAIEDNTTGSDNIMKHSYPAHNTIEYNQIKSSLDSLLERRADAEEILNDCEWYQLLKNLEQVSGDLDETVDRHQKKLVRKAIQEIDKVDRWRKAYRYIERLDQELGKFRRLEEKALKDSTEDKNSKDIVFVGMEERNMSREIEERMHLLERHVNALEKKLKLSKKAGKQEKVYHKDSSDEVDFGQSAAVSDYYLESLKTKIQSLENHVEKQDFQISTLKDQSTHFQSTSPEVERENTTLKHEIQLAQQDNENLMHKIANLETSLHQQDSLIQKLKYKTSRDDGASSEVERENVTLKHEVQLAQQDNDSLMHKVSRLETSLQQQDTLIEKLKNKTSRDEAQTPQLEREKATLKHEISMLQSENEGLTHRVAELETNMNKQDSHIISLRDKASRRKARLTSLSTEHDAIIPVLEQDKATLKHEVSMLQDENDALTHRVAELETQHHSLTEQYTGSSSEMAALREAHKQSLEKNEKRKGYIGSLEEQIKALESNNQRQDKLVIELHGEIEGYKANAEKNKQLIEGLVKEINAHKDSTHLLAQEKLTLDQQLKLTANESNEYGQKTARLEQDIKTLKEQIKAHENFSQTREQRVKALQTEMSSSNDVMNSISEKLTLQKEKAASRERHVRTLEQHVKAQENEILILKKQIASSVTQQTIAPVYAAPGRRSTVAWRDNDSLVEIVRASF